VISPDHINRILVINLKYLGDIIVCTPAIKALRTAYPNSRITYMIRKEYVSAVAAEPSIDDTLLFDYSIRTLKGIKRLKEELRWVRRIRSGNYDAVIALHPGDRYTLWAWLSGAMYRVAPRKQGFGYLNTIRVDVYEDTISYREYYLSIVAAFGALPVTRKTEFIVPVRAGQWSEEFFRDHGRGNTRTLISIHPGASEPSKIWPAELFALLIQKLSALHNTSIVLLQGPMERQIIDRIKRSVSTPLCIVDTTSDIGRMAAIIQRSNLCIVNDSAARHLSVAVGTPTLALLPDDTRSTWHFYQREDGHYTILGKRNPGTETSQPFLGEISVDIVFENVKELLNLR
jgi:ADP-heptose:LPS heptosyltransferase